MQRVLIRFAILFPLKYGLALTPLPPVGQVMLLTPATTGVVWVLRSAGAGNRRLMLAFTALLWGAAAIKIWRAQEITRPCVHRSSSSPPRS